MVVNIYDELLRLSTAADALALDLGAVKDDLAAAKARIKALEDAAKPKLRMAPVSYFYPGPKWDTLLLKKPSMVQINPASGPGTAADAVYVAQVAKCRAAGVPVYGYVHTRYGARPVAEVKADVQRYVAWYGVDGIFVDTTSTRPEHLPYYADLCGWLRSLGLRVVLNPGTKCLEQHLQLADYVMVAETDAVTYRGLIRPAFEANYPGKCWHVVHSCPAADVAAVVAQAKAQGAGQLYVTDDLMPNPYDRLPTYLDDLVYRIGAA